jgi:hypothetical protein
MASTVMIAGTALIQVICCASIVAQNLRRLNARSSTRQAPAACAEAAGRSPRKLTAAAIRIGRRRTTTVP